MKLLIMHFVMMCQVAIGSVTLTQKVGTIDIESSWQTIADTAVVTIPKNITNLTADTFKPGDRVSISMGYEGKIFEEVFTGFVKQRKPNIPFEILCEDAAYLMRGTNIQKAWKATTLKEIVSYLLDETNKNNADYQLSFLDESTIPEVNFTSFRIANATAYEVLETLKDKYGLAFYFRDLKLYCGLPYGEDVGTVKYDLRYNTVDNNLDWREDTDYKLKIKAVGIKKDNSKTEVEVGNDGGSTITKFYYGITSTAELKTLATEDLRKEKLTGYSGSLSGFFVPFVRHSMIANINDSGFPERLGDYRVDAVKYRYDQGIRIVSEIGGQVS